VLPDDGSIAAPPTVTPEAWACALPAETLPLVLAPGSSAGWLGGQSVVALLPDVCADGLSAGEAAATLERVHSGGAPGLAATLLRYDGAAMAAHYAGGLVRTSGGWRAWGAPEVASSAQELLAAGPHRYASVHPSSSSSPSNSRSRSASPLLPAPPVPLAGPLHTDLDARAFHAAVRATIDAITAGDVYVLNLTRRLSGRPLLTPPAAFAALRVRTRADMAALWRTPGLTLASASPERFIRIIGRHIEVWPMKGTRPRYPEPHADRAAARELAASEKERAEHVMIVDLERNDLGRVCRPGSITVNPLFSVLTTPYCHQMVSRVSGQLRDDVALADVLDATFPCGSVTGAPKIAAMRAIERLERSPRGAYTGSLLVATPGHLDSSVLIRTAEYEDGIVRWGTGCGITVDSDPVAEWQESILKAHPFCGTHPDPSGSSAPYAVRST